MEADISASHISLLSKPALKVIPVSNLFQSQIIEEAPKLLQIILQWSSREQEPVVRIYCGQNFVQERFLVLETVSFVHHNVGPDNVTEEGLVLPDHLVAGDEDVEAEVALVVLALVLADDLPGLGVPEVGDGVHVRRPLRELLLPGRDGGQRHADQHGTLERVVVEQVFEEADGLDRFPETHLISKNYTVAFTPSSNQEADAIKLIVSHLSIGPSNIIWLLFHWFELWTNSFHGSFVIFGLCLSLFNFLEQFILWQIVFFD